MLIFCCHVRPYVRKIQNGRQIMFQCDRGYSMIEPGPSGATCIAGEWSPPQLPRCVEGSHPSLRLADNKHGGM